MSDESALAEGAGPEVVLETEAQEAPEMQGETKAEDGREVSEAKSRRERQKAARDRMEADLAEARKAEAETKARHQRLLDAAKVETAPTEADFPDPIEHAAASAHWKMNQRTLQREAQAAEKAAQSAKDAVDAARRAQLDTVEREWLDQATEGARRYADFGEVTARAGAVLTAEAALLIKTSEQAADLAYHLGQNPDLARRISQMNPVDAARTIGRIEAGLVTEKPRQATQAPDPVNPVRGTATATKDPTKMNANEYAAWRAAGGTF